ncbi:MAG: hypothetical protein DI536_22265 [Archangium gephyra]|uniref:SH3 domain-containing protein n=1 Tax=Archangium gephyra TaxID=48 RepID=A0A2W5T0Q3_9BACT|nr:MAG: hypothetical protein DI536_22265 [Archangium gephyra]
MVVLALMSAGSAFAVKVGDNLFVKSKDTKVLKDPKATAAAVVTAQPGDEVKWEGPSDKDKQFHKVTFKGKTGFVLMSNLSPNKPQGEVDASTGKPMSAQAFASSGAATKALTPAGVKYAKGSGVKESEAAAQIIYVEEFNKAKATPTAVAAKAKALETGK